jgi:hypothetical protein
LSLGDTEELICGNKNQFGIFFKHRDLEV